MPPCLSPLAWPLWNPPVGSRCVGTVDTSAKVEIKSQIAGRLRASTSRKSGCDRRAGAARDRQASVRGCAAPGTGRGGTRSGADCAVLAAAQKDTAQARAAEADAKRFTALADQKLVSEQQRLQYATSSETAAASVRADEAAIETSRAALKVDQAAVERAQLDIAYCTSRRRWQGVPAICWSTGQPGEGERCGARCHQPARSVVCEFQRARALSGDHPARERGAKLQVEMNRAMAPRRRPWANLPWSTTPSIRRLELYTESDGGNPKHQWWPGQFVNARLVLDPASHARLRPPKQCRTDRMAPMYSSEGGSDGEARDVVVSRTLEHRALSKAV